MNQIFKDLGLLVHEQGDVIGMLRCFVFRPQVISSRCYLLSLWDVTLDAERDYVDVQEFHWHFDIQML